MVWMLPTAHAERFSISRMRDFFGSIYIFTTKWAVIDAIFKLKFLAQNFYLLEVCEKFHVPNVLGPVTTTYDELSSLTPFSGPSMLILNGKKNS